MIFYASGCFFYSESLKNFNCKKGSIGEMTSLHSGKITDESEPLSEESFENYAIFRRIFLIAGPKPIISDLTFTLSKEPVTSL